MVTDDPKPAHEHDQGTAPEAPAPPTAGESPVRRTTLERLIAESPQGLDVRRVLAWADQLAAAVDDLHDRGRTHGSIDAAGIFVDEHDRARLAVGARGARQPTERELLLGEAEDLEPAAPVAGRPRDDVRALALVLYEALGGNRDAAARGAMAPPIPGVSVQVNLALLAAVSPARRGRVERAGDLARMLRGAAVGQQRRARRLRRAWLNRAATALMATAAVVAVVAGVRLWNDSGAARGTRDGAPEADNGVTAAGRDIQEALAARAELRREAAPAPAVEPPAQRAARVEAERAAVDWEEALAGAPASWLDDDAVHAACTESLLLAEGAETAMREGRYQQAARDFETAVQMIGHASALHEEVAADLAAAPHAEPGPGPDPAPDDVGLGPVQTYLAMAWVPPGAPVPVVTAAAAAPPPARDEAVEEPDEAPVEQVGEAPVEETGEAPAAEAPRRDAPILVNALSQTLILIEPGEFLMGSPHAEPLRDEGEWQHRVRIGRAFWMARVEVTRRQFATFVEQTGYVSDAERAGWSHGMGENGRWRQVAGIDWRDPGFPQSDSHPVVCVSLHDALAFCRWLSDHEGRTYRLPTEAEWEYACRAGRTTPYAWGDSVFDEQPRANAADKAWTEQFPDAVGFPWNDGCVFTSPVGRFSSNAWGLFDMHGNVAEWCLDRFEPYGLDAVADVVDAEALSAGDPAPRVMRGGSFAASPAFCRAAHRDAGPPGASFVTVGFRVVMEVDAR
jgi:sulfatase modifying factor 1